MDFNWPWLLPLLLAVPILIALYVVILRRRARFALRYSSLMVVRDAQGKGPKIRRHIPAAFFFLGLTAMLVGMARPVALVTLPSRQSTIILAIDVSGSMRARDIEPSRFEAAQSAAIDFIDRQPPDTRIGIVSFAGTTALVQAPTTDHNQLIQAISELRLGPRTAIGSAILASLDAIFENPDSSTATTAVEADPATPTPVPQGFHVPAVVILLTDGQSNTGISPLEAAQTAADRGVRVYTVGVGTTQGATIGGGGFGQGGFFGQSNPFGQGGLFGSGGGFGQGGGYGRGYGFRTELDEQTLKTVAAVTDAQYFRATDESQLMDIYRNLNTETIIRTERMEITAGFTGAGALLLLLGVALSVFWINRLP